MSADLLKAPRSSAGKWLRRVRWFASWAIEMLYRWRGWEWCLRLSWRILPADVRDLDSGWTAEWEKRHG